MIRKKVLFAMLICFGALLKTEERHFPKNYKLSYGGYNHWTIAVIQFNQQVSDEFYDAFSKLMEEKLGSRLIAIQKDGENGIKLNMTRDRRIEGFHSIIDEAIQSLNRPTVVPEKPVVIAQAVEEVPALPILPPQEMLRNAIINDSLIEVDKAIRSGAVINFDDYSKSPLLHALLSRKLKAAEELLKSGANPNIKISGKTLVEYYLTDPVVLLLLLKNGANYSGKFAEEPSLFDYALKRFASENYQKIIDFLISKGHDLRPFLEEKNLEKNLWYQSLLNIGESTIPSFHFFIKQGANPNQIFVQEDGTTWTPLLLIVNQKLHPKILDASPRGREKEFQRLKNHYNQAIYNLRSAGADINKEANPILNKSAQNPLSLALIANKYDTYYDLILMEANLEKAIDLLIKSGEKPTIVNNAPLKGYAVATLLIMAIEKQNPELVKKLLDTEAYHSGEINYALSFALKLPNLEIIEMLIRALK